MSLQIGPVTEFVGIMERAGRKGTRAHVAPDVVRHILAHPAWLAFMAERQRELVSQWQSLAPISEPTGSSTRLSKVTDRTAGSIPQLVHDTAERRALEAAAELSRLRRRGRR